MLWKVENVDEMALYTANNQVCKHSVNVGYEITLAHPIIFGVIHQTLLTESGS